MAVDGVSKQDKEKIIGILTVLFPGVSVYLYGSRARGQHRQWSDIDLAIDAGQKIDRHRLAEARDMLEQSRIPYKVSLVDYHGTSQELQQNIDQDKVIWKQ